MFFLTKLDQFIKNPNIQINHKFYASKKYENFLDHFNEQFKTSSEKIGLMNYKTYKEEELPDIVKYLILYHLDRIIQYSLMRIEKKIN